MSGQRDAVGAAPAYVPSFVRVSGLAILSTLAFVGIRLIRVGGASGFPIGAAPWVSPGAGLRLYPEGYDGQFVYRLSLAPFTHARTANGITLDDPPYRQQRIATALLAHLVSKLPGLNAVWALLLVNAVAVVAAGVLASYLVASFGRRLRWAPVLAVPAYLPISLGRDLTEPVAWASLLLALLAIRHKRWFWAAVSLTVAVLARETSLVVVAGLGLVALVGFVRGPSRPWRSFWLLLPVLVEAGWQIHLSRVWHSRLPLLLGDDNASAKPVIGVFQSFFAGLPARGVNETILGLSYLCERIVLLALIGTAAVEVLRRGVRASAGEQLSWALAAALALTLRDWGRDVQFLRAAAESWEFSVLMLVSVPERRSRTVDLVLAAAGVVSVAVAVLYALRP